MIVCLDSSALLRLCASEVDSNRVRSLIEEADRVAGSVVAYPEVRAALSRRQREGSFSLRGLRRALLAPDGNRPSFVIIAMSAVECALGASQEDSLSLGLAIGGLIAE